MVKFQSVNTIRMFIPCINRIYFPCGTRRRYPLHQNVQKTIVFWSHQKEILTEKILIDLDNEHCYGVHVLKFDLKFIYTMSKK